MTIYTNNYIICEFCNGNHNCRECPIEKAVCSEIKLTVGLYMEEFVENNIKCSNCNLYSLQRLGDNSPSLDLKCYICNKKIEVKSKCLSIDKLPNDIQCKGGNFNNFKFNIEQKQLDLILIIYGVNRKSKKIYIREMYNINNDILLHSHNVEITQNDTSSCSMINIKDKNLLDSINTKNIPTISFKPLIKKLIKNINKLI